jgi:hypothetical protein
MPSISARPPGAGMNSSLPARSQAINNQPTHPFRASPAYCRRRTGVQSSRRRPA